MTLHFDGGKTSEIKVTKDGRKWMYFTALANNCKYRLDKKTGEVQIAPYWSKSKMYVD